MDQPTIPPPGPPPMDVANNPEFRNLTFPNPQTQHLATSFLNLLTTIHTTLLSLSSLLPAAFSIEPAVYHHIPSHTLHLPAWDASVTAAITACRQVLEEFEDNNAVLSVPDPTIPPGIPGANGPGSINAIMANEMVNAAADYGITIGRNLKRVTISRQGKIKAREWRHFVEMARVEMDLLTMTWGRRLRREARPNNNLNHRLDFVRRMEALGGRRVRNWGVGDVWDRQPPVGELGNLYADIAEVRERLFGDEDIGGPFGGLEDELEDELEGLQAALGQLENRDPEFERAHVNTERITGRARGGIDGRHRLGYFDAQAVERRRQREAMTPGEREEQVRENENIRRMLERNDLHPDHIRRLQEVVRRRERFGLIATTRPQPQDRPDRLQRALQQQFAAMRPRRKKREANGPSLPMPQEMAGQTPIGNQADADRVMNPGFNIQMMPGGFMATELNGDIAMMDVPPPPRTPSPAGSLHKGYRPLSPFRMPSPLPRPSRFGDTFNLFGRSSQSAGAPRRVQSVRQNPELAGQESELLAWCRQTINGLNPGYDIESVIRICHLFELNKIGIRQIAGYIEIASSGMKPMEWAQEYVARRRVEMERKIHDEGGGNRKKGPNGEEGGRCSKQ